MQPETKRKLIQLAATLHELRGQPRDAYVLVIGSGTSTIQGRPIIAELQRRVLLAEWGAGLDETQLSSMSFEQLWSKFDQVWSEMGNALKIRTFRSLYEKLTTTPGHTALALLLKESFFPLVLTTTMDPLIEHSFISSTTGEGLNLRQWSVLVNGRDDERKIQSAIQSIASDTPLILKLYGDFQSQTFAVTQMDVQRRVQETERTVGDALKRDLIIVGYTPFDDLIIRSFPSEGGSVYFIGTERPPQDSYFEKHLWHRRPIYIIDEESSFDTVFRTIVDHLKLFREYEETTSQSLDKEAFKRVEETTQVSETMDEALFEVIKQQQSIISFVKTAIFTVEMDGNRRVGFDVVGGAFNYSGVASKEWDINVDAMNQVMQEMGYNIAAYHRARDQRGRDMWRGRAKLEGIRLYEELQRANPDLGRKLEVARKTAIEEDPENLTLVFSGPRNYLGLPYELLHDNNAPLAISHPLCHKVTGVGSRHTHNFNDFVQTLRQQKLPLKILLIASDTGGLAADAEITSLENLITERAKRIGLQIEIEPMHTEKASLINVKQRLAKCVYHVVHYAGHGRFDEASGENSSLVFWQEENRRGNKAALVARELAGLLAASETRLFYLSSCVGATIASDRVLQNNDYLGVMDAIVQAGISYVLGFRWSVTDSGGRRFANLFYDRLFSRPHVPERAVLYARKKIYDAQGTDETWTSPILVAQNPYG